MVAWGCRTCREQGSCLYSAAIYGGQSNLDANEEIAKATCKDNEDYQDNLVNGDFYIKMKILQ